MLIILLIVLPTSELPPATKGSKVTKMTERKEFPLQFYKFLHTMLTTRLEQYPSKLEDDVKHLDVYRHRLESGMWLTNLKEMRRRAMAMSIRIGEKEILRDGIKEIEDIVKTKEEETVSKGEKRRASSRPASGRSTPKKARR